MTKKYLTAFFSLVFIFGVSFSVFAQSINTEASVESRPVQVQSQMRVRINSDFKAIHEAQRTQLEEQREHIRTEAEVRRADAKEAGDDARARRETIRLEIEAKWAERDEQREAVRVEAESKRAEARAEALTKRVEFQQAVAERKIEKVTKVILVTIERLEQIIVRIESRVAKVQARGGDTAESERFVLAAKGNLADARLVVGTFAGIDLSGDDARENFERIRIAVATVREHIRAAHQNLMMAVRSLRSNEITLEVDVSVE